MDNKFSTSGKAIMIVVSAIAYGFIARYVLDLIMQSFPSCANLIDEYGQFLVGLLALYLFIFPLFKLYESGKQK